MADDRRILYTEFADGKISHGILGWYVRAAHYRDSIRFSCSDTHL